MSKTNFHSEHSDKYPTGVKIEFLQKKIVDLEKYINKLEKEKAELSVLLNEGGVAMLSGNEKGKIIDCNKKALILTGYTREELINKNISELFSNQMIPESFLRKETGEPPNEFTSEQLLIKKNGKKIYVSTLSILLSNGTYQISVSNIDKQKKSELALIESECRFRKLAENMYDVVWTMDNELKLIFVSSIIVDLTGFSSQYYSMKPINEVITAISYRLIKDTFFSEENILAQRINLSNKYHISVDIKLLHKTKGSVWVNLKAVPLQNKLGKITGYQGVFRDIEDKRKMLDNLKKYQKKYKFALEATQSGVWEIDSEMINIVCDKHIYQMLGYKTKPQNILFSNWMNTIYPEDRMYVMDILESILEQNISHKVFECRRLHKEGYWLWFKEHVKVLLGSEGKVLGIIGTMKNITAEKRVEDKKFKYYAGIQLLIDSAIQFLSMNSINEMNDFIGETLIKIIPNSVIITSDIDETKKMALAKSVYGIDYSKFVDEFKEIEWNPFVNKVILSEKFIKLLKKRTLVQYKGGFKQFVEDFFNQKIDDSNHDKLRFKDVYVIGVIADEKIFSSIIILLNEGTGIVSQDFIEAFIYIASVNILRKHIENELLEQKEALLKSEKKYKKLNATKDMFFSVISHDLKNPFNTIIGFSGLLMNNYKSLESEKIFEFAKFIYEAAKSSYDMMLNLFQWAKSQRGKLKPVMTEININELIAGLVRLFAGETVKKELKLRFIPVNAQIIVSDYNIIDTVLRNLVSNAIKFSKRKGLIQIVFNKGKDYFQIDVVDNGVGIDAKQKDKIFKAEGNKTTYGTENEKGSGLGLILSKELIELLGGKIWFESNLGEGTVFSIKVPLSQN